MGDDDDDAVAASSQQQHMESQDETTTTAAAAETRESMMQLLAIDVYALIDELLEPHENTGLCFKKAMEVYNSRRT